MHAEEFKLNFTTNVKKNANDVVYELLIEMDSLGVEQLSEKSRRFLEMFKETKFVEDSEIFLRLCFIKAITKEQLSIHYDYCARSISQIKIKIDVNELCESIAQHIVLMNPILDLKNFTENFKYLQLLAPYSRYDMKIYLEHYSIALFNYLISNLTKDLNIIEAIVSITGLNLPEPISTEIANLLKSLLRSMTLSIRDNPKTLYFLKYYSFFITKFGQDNTLKDQFDSIAATRLLELLDSTCENVPAIPRGNQDIAVQIDFDNKTTRIVYCVESGETAMRKAVKDVVLIIDFFEMCKINRKIAVGVEESKEQVWICIEIHAEMRFLIRDFGDIGDFFPYEKAHELMKNIVRLVVKSQAMGLYSIYFPALLLLVDSSEVILLPNSFFAQQIIEKQQRSFNRVFDSNGEANDVCWLAQLILLIYRQRPEVSEDQKKFNGLLNQMLRDDPSITWERLSSIFT